ncbi:PA2169 family four-helix-bundle protein [Phragmitibacter flavus]|uniref:PA2169 family four-helix-bundle protein n=1 Tax=Phragmitibacter flavus TaxID=2576071 RepID=A0A5R8KK13_9BACT|nr:PA2169 family four-helix-bundle protein [Phragmitibacter flavus]TLD72275.1 PA2169 family four-helix-bundle protein [Phragmitibacter flavus]
MNTTANTPDAKDVRGVLDNLIEISKDGQEGYRLASEHATDPALKQAFSERSASRARFVSQLQDLQTRYGTSDPQDSGSVSGSLHRAWLQIRSTVARREDQAILEEAERGEDAAVAAYREALTHQPPLPADAVTTVQAQAAEVKEDHDFVRDLRDSGRFEVKTNS